MSLVNPRKAHFTLISQAGATYCRGAIAPAVAHCDELPQECYALAEYAGALPPASVALLRAVILDPNLYIDLHILANSILRERLQSLAFPGFRFGRFMVEGNLFWGYSRQR